MPTHDDSDAIWARVAPILRKEFSAVLAAAVPAGEFAQASLFSSEEEKIIGNGLDRLFYKRRLPNGSDKEIAIAAKITRLVNIDPQDRGKPEGLKGITGLGAAILAEQYRQTVGWYYTLKPLSDSATSRWLKTQIAEANKPEADRNQDLIWFCELRLKGIPTQVGNFRMTCFYTLHRADGKRDRIVEIETEAGEKSGKIRLDAESFSTPSGRSGFRTWLMNHGNGCWKGGERELQDLQLDMAHDAAYLDVQEVTALGEDVGSGLWFFGDGCIGNGGMLVPDRDGVYWMNDIGYQLSSTGSGNQPFAQGFPLMHPGQVLQSVVKASSDQDARPEIIFSLVPAAEAKQSEKEAVEQLFGELVFRIQEALGSPDAYLVFGSFLSFVGRTAFFKQEKCFPGLILHGETGQGKTTMIQWMIELAGFHQMAEGVGLSRNSTVVGLQILLEQYSCLPGWLSDFNNVDVSAEKQQIMHGAYNAGLSVKWTADGTTRKSRTMFVIDGESRPSKTSTRFRYVQVLVSKANRRSNQVWWFEKNRKFFFTIWRHLLLHEKEFVGMMMQNFADMSQQFSDVERRAVQVHGPASGAFLAAVQMFGQVPDSEVNRFVMFLRNKCETASEQRELSVNVNQFWVDLISAYGRGVFGETTGEKQRFFKAVAEDCQHPPAAGNLDASGAYLQGPWKSYMLFIEMNGVLDLLRKDLRQQGKTMVLDKGDLIEQMSRRPYYAERNRTKHGCRQRFGTSTSMALRCVAIDVDKMEDFGYRKISDEEFEKSWLAPVQPDLPSVRVPGDRWNDPRKGDLFSIIEAVKIEKEEV